MRSFSCGGGFSVGYTAYIEIPIIWMRGHFRVVFNKLGYSYSFHSRIIYKWLPLDFEVCRKNLSCPSLSLTPLLWGLHRLLNLAVLGSPNLHNENSIRGDEGVGFGLGFRVGSTFWGCSPGPATMQPLCCFLRGENQGIPTAVRLNPRFYMSYCQY